MDSIFWLSLFLYLVSILASVAAIQPKTSIAKQMAHWVYIGGFLAMSTDFVLRQIETQTWRLAQSSDGLLMTVMVVGLLYVTLRRFVPHAMMTLVVACLSIGLAILALVQWPFGADSFDRVSGLSGHVVFMYLSLAAFSISFISAVMYLIQEGLIRQKKIGNLFLNLPSLELMGRANLIFLILGIASFIAGTMQGWLDFKNSDYGLNFLFEPTVIVSFIVLGLYFGIIVLQIGSWNRGRRIAVGSLLSYVVLLTAFFIQHKGQTIFL